MLADFDIDKFALLRDKCIELAVRRGAKCEAFDYDAISKYIKNTKTFVKYVAMRQHFASANIGLVGMVISRGFTKWIDRYGFHDLLAEGTFGLLRAIDRYDPTIGEFSTYATWWIRHFIQRALENNMRTVRIPTHRIDAISKLRTKAQRGNITDDELVQLHVWETALYSSDPLPQIVDNAHTMFSDALALESVVDILRQFEPRERTIVVLRYGLDGSEERSYEELGKLFAVSRERIRQVESKVIEKIRRRLQLCDSHKTSSGTSSSS